MRFKIPDAWESLDKSYLKPNSFAKFSLEASLKMEDKPWEGFFCGGTAHVFKGVCMIPIEWCEMVWF